MNDDKLKKLEEFCGRFNALMISGQYCERDGKIKDSDDYDYVEDILPDLIKHCRQLEKDKQRLQKANDELFGQMTEESDRADKAEEAQAELLAVLTTDEVDHSTLVETLNSARRIILRLEPEYCYELTEELCAWAEKLTKHKGE